jgi:hypothetical protein
MAKTNTQVKAPANIKTPAIAQNKPNRPTPAKTKTITKPVLVDDGSLADLLADDVTPVAVEVVSDTTGALITSADVETHVNKDEAYANQKNTLSVTGTKVKGKAKSTGRVTKAREAGAAGVGRSRKVMLASDIAAFYDDPAAKIAAISALPIKIQDKARNALLAMSGNARASTYTRQAIEALTSAPDNTMTAKELKAFFVGCKYSDGTSAAQAQQQMVLLNFIGAAARDKSSLKLLVPSTITDAIMSPTKVAIAA